MGQCHDETRSTTRGSIQRARGTTALHDYTEGGGKHAPEASQEHDSKGHAFAIKEAAQEIKESRLGFLSMREF
jgi:hypothetical protein